MSKVKTKFKMLSHSYCVQYRNSQLNLTILKPVKHADVYRQYTIYTFLYTQEKLLHAEMWNIDREIAH